MKIFTVGISLSQDVVRIALIQKERKGYAVTNVSRLVVDNSQSLQELLRTWSKKHIPQNAKVSAAISFPDASLFLKHIDVPLGNNRETTEAVRWELTTKDSTFPKDALLSWMPIKTAQGTMSVTAMALRQTEALQILQAPPSQNWLVEAIEPATISFSRLMHVPKEPWMHISVDGNQAVLSISLGNCPQFSTFVDLGQSGTSVSSGKLTHEAVGLLGRQVREVMKYWKSRSGDPLSRIVLAADASKSSLVRRQMKKLFHMPVEILKQNDESASVVGTVSENIRMEFGAALGAALRLCSYEFDTGVNFLPVNQAMNVNKQVRSDQFMDAFWQLARINLLFTGIFVVFFASILVLTQAYQKKITENIDRIASHPAQTLVSQVNRTNELLKAANNLAQNQQDIGARLAFFGSNTPTGLTYSAVKLTNGENQAWTIEGTADRTSILAFYYKLYDVVPGSFVTMPYSNLQKDKDAFFKIHVLWQ